MYPFKTWCKKDKIIGVIKNWCKNKYRCRNFGVKNGYKKYPR